MRLLGMRLYVCTKFSGAGVRTHCIRARISRTRRPLKYGRPPHCKYVWIGHGHDSGTSGNLLRIKNDIRPWAAPRWGNEQACLLLHEPEVTPATSTEVTPRAQKLSQSPFHEDTAVFKSHVFETVFGLHTSHHRTFEVASSQHPQHKQNHLQLLAPTQGTGSFSLRMQLDYREPPRQRLRNRMFQGPLTETKMIFKRWPRRRAQSLCGRPTQPTKTLRRATP